MNKNKITGNDRAKLKAHLHECLRREVICNDKPFSWWRVMHKAVKCPMRRFYFWWRIASHLYNDGNYVKKRIAFKINRMLVKKYNTEIQLPAQIAPGLNVAHFLSVVINGCAIIGENFKIRQNTTIGISGKTTAGDAPRIIIGDNVEIGANSCIIGDNLHIGNNIIIGAMSFINRDIPDNCTVYTEKKNKIIINKSA